MKRVVFLVLPLLLSSIAIKIPVEPTGTSGPDVSDADSEHSNNNTQSKPIYYTSDEPVDSYLIPPDPHRPSELLDAGPTPATYLLPPSEDKQTNFYYAPTDTDSQSEWYPIAQEPTKNQQIQLLPPRLQSPVIPIFLSGNQTEPLKIQNPRTGKVLGHNVPVPSQELQPPAEDAPNDYIIQVPSEELQLPAEEIDHSYLPIQGNPKLVNYKPARLVPLKSDFRKFKHPTKLYPKKFNGGGFKPVPIPIGQFADDSSLEVPKARPAKYFKPLPSIEDALPPTDDKRIYLFEQAEQKRKLKDSEESQDHEDLSSAEQDAAETYRYPGQNVYPPSYHAPVPYRGAPVPLRVAPVPLGAVPVPLRVAPAPLRVAPNAAPAPRPASTPQPQAPPAPDDRTEFRMHGMKGPHSYQFGYDTGKGKNRQFRYEERDNDGLVRGHYGYMDKHGKLRVVNYSAHPEHGFQAHPQEEENKE